MIWRFIPCRHEWQYIESGAIERGGHSLAAGSILGVWTKYRCSKCGFSKTETRID